MPEQQDSDRPAEPTVVSRRRRSPWEVDIPNKTADCNATLDAIIAAMDKMAEISGNPEYAYHQPEKTAAPPEPENESEDESADEPELSKEDEEKARMDNLHKKLEETFAGSLEHVNDEAVRGAIDRLFLLCALQTVYIRDVVLGGKLREAEALVKAVRATKPVNPDNILAAEFIKTQYKHRIGVIKEDPESFTWLLMPFRPRIRMRSRRKDRPSVDMTDSHDSAGGPSVPSDCPGAIPESNPKP